VRLVLEVTGGFTGPAGKRRLEVDTARLAPKDAARIEHALEQVPGDTWGKRFLSPHPQSFEFLHVLRIDDGGDRSVTFHLHQGPPALSELAKLAEDLSSDG